MFGRTDMVKNNAGGYVFPISEKELLERFLLLGTEGGTYYASEQKLTEENATKILGMIKRNSVEVAKITIDSLQNRKAPKVDAGIFVLALVASYGNAEAKKLVYNAISTVLVTGTHLFMFLANVQNLRGWSRGLRNGVAAWYTSKDFNKLAYQLVKYRSRAEFNHRDALRLCHAKATNEDQNILFKYAVGKCSREETASKLIRSYEAAKTATDKQLLKLIGEGLTWEMVPTEMLNNTEVLKALLDNMPLTALIRNLNRFAYNGLTSSNNETTKKIVARLRDIEAVKKSGLHPVFVVNSMRTYVQGHGDRGSKTWTANQNIVDALNDMYSLALANIVPTNKDILVMSDISGSMSASVGGMTMSASQIAQVLGVTILKSEPNAELYNFDTQVYQSNFGRRSSIDEVIKFTPRGGGTDCALAFKTAIRLKRKYDAIIILTDNETWAGQRHGLELLNEYRRKYNKDVKVIEIALASNPYSQLPQDDKNVLRVVGFDNSVIDLINKFIS